MWRFVVVLLSVTSGCLSGVTHRQEGSGEVYAYMPESKRNTEELLAVPGSHDNYPYGISVGRGAFVFPPGQWVTVAERVKLNDIEEENGSCSENCPASTVCP